MESVGETLEKELSMLSNKHRVPVPGSERRVLLGARVVGCPHPKERLEVTLYVRPRMGMTAFKGG